MKRRFRCPVQAKKEYVAEVLAFGYRIEAAARRFGMSPRTLSDWVRQYRDEVDELMAKKRNEEEQLKRDAERLQELEKKYSEAMKLIGEKELEINILRELVKKIIPIGSSYTLDQRRVSRPNGVPILQLASFLLLLPHEASQAA
jgi:Transposase.